MYVSTHTTYVGMDDAQKSSFLCDISMTSLFILDGGLKIVNVRPRTHSYNVRGYGDVRKSAFLCDVSMVKLFPLDIGLKIVTVRRT